MTLFRYPFYGSTKEAMTRHRIVAILKSKTFWGSVAAAAGVVLAAPAVTLDVIVQAGGIVLVGAGIRDSFTKIQTGGKWSQHAVEGDERTVEVEPLRFPVHSRVTAVLLTPRLSGSDRGLELAVYRMGVLEDNG